MFYKPSHSNLATMDLTSSEDDQQDSGLGLSDFPRQPSLDMTQSPSLTLDSINEAGEEIEADGMDSINGNLYNLCLHERPSVMNPLQNRKQSQSEVDHDSGLFDSIASTCASVSEVSGSSGDHVSMKPVDDLNLSHHWMTVLSEKCFPSSDGHIDMDQLVAMFQGNQDGDNLLSLFIIHNLAEPALFLIDHAPASDWLDLHNNLRQTPLHLAVMTRQPHILQRLVCSGASQTEIDTMGNTPLHWACAIGCEDSTRYLLDPERDIPESYRNQWFQNRISEVPSDLCKMRNCDGDTCLHLAARGGFLNIVQMLLNYGCDPNIGDGKSGRTVLHHAAEAGHVGLTSLLLTERRTLCDLEDYGRHTAHDLARGHGRSGVMRVLISHGAKPTLTRGKASDSDSEDEDDENFDCNLVIHNGHCSG